MNTDQLSTLYTLHPTPYAQIISHLTALCFLGEELTIYKYHAPLGLFPDGTPSEQLTIDD